MTKQTSNFINSVYICDSLKLLQIHDHWPSSSSSSYTHDGLVLFNFFNFGSHSPWTSVPSSLISYKFTCHFCFHFTHLCLSSDFFHVSSFLLIFRTRLRQVNKITTLQIVLSYYIYNKLCFFILEKRSVQAIEYKMFV